MKIVVAQHKGGVGKTTLATHVAGVLATEDFDKVLLMDCDSQGDAFRFFTKRLPEENMETMEGRDEVDVLWNPSRIKLSNKDSFAEYDHIVVDIDTKIQNSLQIITEISPDIILLPIDQQYLSLMHLDEVLSLIAQCEGKVNYPASVRVIQMGSDYDLKVELADIQRKPRNLYYNYNIPYLPKEFNKSLKDCDYIWNNQSVVDIDIKSLIAGTIENG